jgi:hypothetical protein
MKFINYKVFRKDHYVILILVTSYIDLLASKEASYQPRGLQNIIITRLDFTENERAKRLLTML